MTTGVAWPLAVADAAVGIVLAAAAALAAGAVPVRAGGDLRPRSPVRRAWQRLRSRAASSPTGRRGRRGGKRPGGGRAQVVITQVAGLVRSGMPPDQAWSSVDVSTAADGTPRPEDLVRLTQDPSQAQAVVAACRLAHEVGAPIAPVLDSIVSTLAAAAESAADRDTALAAPRSTARLLLWLPAVGAVLATVLGASPLRLLVDGGPAALAPAVGVLLLLLGRTWTRRLVRSATSHGSG